MSPLRAVGILLDLLQHKTSFACLIIGHTITWKTDTAACLHCRTTFPKVTAAVLDGLDTLEGHAMVARELRP